MRIVELPQTEFMRLPGLSERDHEERAKQERERWDRKDKDGKQGFDPEKHWFFSGGQNDRMGLRKRELMELLRGQSYYENGNKIVVKTAVPGMTMELTPDGNQFRASLKNDRGAVKAELSSFSRKEDLLDFMKKHDVEAPSLVSKQHSRLEDPHKHKGLAREI